LTLTLRLPSAKDALRRPLSGGRDLANFRRPCLDYAHPQADRRDHPARAARVFLGLALAPVAFSSSYRAVPIAFYIVAGLGWLVIAMPLVKWMGRPERTS
jgi:uncharacterized protein DUF2842